MRDEIAGEPVEQLRTPRLAVHLVGVLDDAAAEEPVPDAIDERARQRPLRGSVKIAAAVAVRSASEADGRRAIELGKEEAGVGVLLLRDVAAKEPQPRFVGEKYAASAYASFSFHLLMKLSWQELHFRLTPRKICARVLRRLHPGVWLGADFAAPVDADEEAIRIVGRAGLSSCATNWS